MSIPFSLDEARQLRDFLHSAIIDFAVNGVDTVELLALPEPRYDRVEEQEPSIWPSSISHSDCQKLKAAQRLRIDVAQIEWSDDQMYMFAMAKYAAMMAKVALTESFKLVGQTEERKWSVLPEVHFRGDGFSGRIDALLRLGTNAIEDSNEIRFPVEMKFTDAGKWSGPGIKPSHVWQTIIYMQMVGAMYGFVITLHMKTFEVWLVVRDEAERGYYLYNHYTGQRKVEMLGSTEFPLNDRSEVWFADIHLDAIIKDHRRWLDKFRNNSDVALLDKPEINSDPWTNPCVYKHVPPENYKTSRAGLYQAGDKKPETGVLKSLCPLYGYCHRGMVEAAGYVYTALPEDLPTEIGPDGIECVTHVEHLQPDSTVM